MAEKNKRNIGPLLIILAGCFWGSMGIFVRRLGTYGFTSAQIVSIRVTLAALFFCLILFVKDRGGFRIRARDIPLFLGLGFGSILFFTVCYFTAIRMMPLSTAAILLYTAPTIVMLLSAFLFHERITRIRLIAVACAFAGCCLVSGIGTGTHLTPAGILYGLGAGFGYALYTIFSRYALQRGYSSSTINFYITVIL